MKGTLAPPSRSSTAARTWLSWTRSSAAICRRIFCIVLLLGNTGGAREFATRLAQSNRALADSCGAGTAENLDNTQGVPMRARVVLLVVAILLIAAFAALNWSEVTRTSPLLFGPVVMDAPLGAILLGLLAL